MRSTSRSFAVVFVLATHAGCAETQTQPSTNPLKYAEEAEALYNRGEEAFYDRDWEEAKTLLSEVKRKYAYSPFARKAELLLADIEFEQEKYSSAISAFRTFVHDHRTDRGAVYARFRILKALFAQISDTVLLPPQEERDQTAVLDAYRELNSFLLDYPNTEYTKEAKFMLVAVTDRLVRHELYVARYLLARDQFEPALRRIQFALREYEGSGLEPEAMLLLAETYMKLKRTDKAVKVLKELIATYPASPFAEPAKTHLARLTAS